MFRAYGGPCRRIFGVRPGDVAVAALRCAGRDLGEDGRDGFRLARPAGEITLLEIVEAVDGARSSYECREIRRQGTGALPDESCTTPCLLAAKMAEAHEAWRQMPAASSPADIVAALPSSAPGRTRRIIGAASYGGGAGDG